MSQFGASPFVTTFVSNYTKKSFNSDEPIITKHTSKVYKEGETLNDTKASGVNDIITYNSSCIYDNDNNNVIL